MKFALVLFVFAALGVLLAGCAVNQSRSTAQKQIAAKHQIDMTLDQLHDAAAKADEARYFSLFAKDGIFLGTDDTERWTVEEFRAYAHPFFSQGKGWTYTVAERFIYFTNDGKTAWFDERLDNAKWGRCRGSGVLVKTPQGWKIVQYNLLVPIPNDLLPEIAERIKEFAAQPASIK